MLDEWFPVILARNHYLEGSLNIHDFTPNPPTNIVDFRGFDSSIILIIRGGIPRPLGDIPESLSQAMLVGNMLVGRLGVKLNNLDEHKLTRRLYNNQLFA